ncbi:MAG: TonB-dependent receptor [Chromatiaceae bacterium]|nr:TonB-dependent receptor [Chromatiaceae bacterium]MCP5429192.1 TonB-dependent receptor [Chromatiaceae bacterium]MCP5434735.1 TonB-dependent receptor [Chromatiaceae bacterium]MCW5586239.1 TonB-dependent receptor [Chromatiales bacterium]
MLSNRISRYLLPALALMCCRADLVSARGFDGVEVHGFATQGYIKTSANSFFGDSEDGSFEFTELGVNASMDATENIRLSGQLLSRSAGEMYSGTPSIDFALADYTVRSTENDNIGVMVGRIKNPLGLFNETRDVAFTRPGFLVPQVVYYDKVRNLILSADGVAARMASFGEAANVSLYLAAGQTRIDENVEYVYLGNGYDGDFSPNGLSYIGRVLVEKPDNTLRASLSIASTSMDFERGVSDPIGNGNVSLVYGIGSLQYAVNDWTFTSEYMREPIEWQGFAGSPLDGKKATGESYYFQVAWQARSDVELMLRYGEGYADRSDRSGAEIQKATGGALPAHTQYSKIATAGVRWDLTPQVMVRAEYQRHNGTLVLSNRENPIPAATVPDWDMFALSISYRF